MCEAQNQPVTFSDLKPLPRGCGVGIGPLPVLLGMVRSSRAISLVSFNTYLITVNWVIGKRMKLPVVHQSQTDWGSILSSEGKILDELCYLNESLLSFELQIIFGVDAIGIKRESIFQIL